MTNFEKVKEEFKLEDFINNFHRGFCKAIHKVRGEEYCSSRSCEKCKEWLKQEYKPQILTDKEREYLAAVIKPFRDKVASITKEENSHPISEHIIVTLIGMDNYEDYLIFPDFELDAMYKNMEIGKEYKLSL